MRSRPWPLTLLAFILGAIIISFPIQIAALYGHGIGELPIIFSKMTYLNWMVSGFCLITMLLALQGHQILKSVFNLTIFIVFVNNAVVAASGMDFSLAQTGFASACFLSLRILINFPSIKHILKNQNMRWWLIPTRKHMELDLELRFEGEEKAIKAKSYDLSSGGMFIPLYTLEETAQGKFNEDILDKELVVSFKIGELDFNLPGKVVRICEARGTYPSGIGLQFQRSDFLFKLNYHLA